MLRIGKVWGEVWEIFEQCNVRLTRIRIDKGGFSSQHKHEHAYNAFIIESGRLKIKTWKNDYDLCDETIVGPQEMTVVAPGEFHMFDALEETVAYELYWVDINKNDIVRKNCGGNTESTEGE